LSTTTVVMEMPKMSTRLLTKPRKFTLGYATLNRPDNQTIIRTRKLRFEKQLPSEEAQGIVEARKTQYPELHLKIRFTPECPTFKPTTTSEDRETIEKLNKQLTQGETRLDIYIPPNQLGPFYETIMDALTQGFEFSIERKRTISELTKVTGLSEREIRRLLKRQLGVKRRPSTKLTGLSKTELKRILRKRGYPI